MSHLFVSVASIGVGVSLRRRFDHLLTTLVRGQYVLISAPLCFLGGLLFHFQPMSVAAIGLIQVGEIGAILLGAHLYRRTGAARERLRRRLLEPTTPPPGLSPSASPASSSSDGRRRCCRG